MNASPPHLRTLIVLVALGAASVGAYRYFRQDRDDNDEEEGNEEEDDAEELSNEERRSHNTDLFIPSGLFGDDARVRHLYVAYVACLCGVAYIARERIMPLITPNRIAVFLAIALSLAMHRFGVPLVVIVVTIPTLLLGVPHGLRRGGL